MFKTKYQQLKGFTESNGLLPVVLVSITIVLGSAYIWQVNISATTGYEMRELSQSIDDLKLEKDKLDLKVAKLQSVDSVSTRVQMLGLSKVSKIEYITPDRGAVAINR